MMPSPALFKFIPGVQPLLRSLLGPIFRPITRVFVGLIAIPAFRFTVRHVFRVKEIDEETEKDLGEWFRGSMLLLFATPNMEYVVGSLIGLEYDVTQEMFAEDRALNFLITAGRLLLAVAAIESMPDQQLFSIIHPGPPKLTYEKPLGFWGNVRKQFKPVSIGILCKHLNQSSPVFAILAVIMPGKVGWVCFGIAATQYLIIGMVTSRDRAVDVLTQFDQRMAERRQEIIDEFHITQDETEAPIDVPPPTRVIHVR